MKTILLSIFLLAAACDTPWKYDMDYNCGNTHLIVNVSPEHGDDGKTWTCPRGSHLYGEKIGGSISLWRVACQCDVVSDGG